MSRSSALLWFALVLILLLPTAAGRIFLDIAGGLMFALIALPIVITGVGWIGWQLLKSRLIQCEVCGASIINNSAQCPICGSVTSTKEKSQGSSPISNSIPASSATIDISAEETK